MTAENTAENITYTKPFRPPYPIFRLEVPVEYVEEGKKVAKALREMVGPQVSVVLGVKAGQVPIDD